METLVDLKDVTVTDDDFIEIAEEMRVTGHKFRMMRLAAGWFIRLPDTEHEDVHGGRGCKAARSLAGFRQFRCGSTMLISYQYTQLSPYHIHMFSQS